MSDLVSLLVPEQCPLCRETRVLSVEPTINGRVVVLDWACRRCAHRWPVYDEQLRSPRERKSR